ncbi:asparagine synthase-related protein [Nesterenkonia sp. HG001]|uniref:asparagine synthase-related protein n=1 Tax=Nesterenkonia sp. HG001 TaxID=2983207 RepID=UPI002AC46EE5|nr:asparagine synthase-related protein [Nesterenkonia sp. HG001]MDZ5076999.1 asparagine synthase-related protein [Nesterenkonia sp. HG001]
MTETTRVCGMLGAGDPARVRRMAGAAGLAPEESGTAVIVDRPAALLIGSTALRARPEVGGEAWMFSTATPEPAGLGTAPVRWEHAARDADVAGVVLEPDGAMVLHTGISGVQPVYVEQHEDVVYFATELNLLVDTAPGLLAPDWTGWAQIIGIGAPLAGRTTVEGIRRLGPMEQVRLEHGGAPRGRRVAWPWEQITPEPGLSPESLTGDVLEAMRGQVAALGESGPLQPMLSGGRDSRLLTGLADELGQPGGLTAWTTSSDTGTTLEELTAARIASRLGIRQRIVPGRHDGFAQDFAEYAEVTGHQASFHVWLMPVARELARQQGTVLDGLGGGVFLGGGFPDDPAVLQEGGGPQELMTSRFGRLARYLQVAEELLAPGVAGALTAAGRDDFMRIAEPLAEHPQGATLTAYLTRTLPGISMAPAAVLGGSRPTAVPIMSHQVVSQALRVEHAAKRDGRWYPGLLRRVRPEFDDIPTAADLTTGRQHVRRGASLDAAAWYRELVMTSPAAALLGDKLREGDAELWRRQLTRTRAQHLIRGLALMALWLRRHEDRLTETDPTPLRHG